jgi:hypothetical protein
MILGLGLPAIGLLATGAEPAKTARPRYTARGELELPGGFHSWVFVGADLAPSYQKVLSEGTERKDQANAPTRKGHEPEIAGDFHHIYINREAYEHYLKHEEFPDPTILMMEVFRSESKDSKGILTSGRVEGPRVGLEAAVKDTRRPGGGVPWAYYNFENVAKSAEPFKPASSARPRPDAACFDCHEKWADKDNVWVQFYPVLRDAELRDVKQP